MNIQRLYNLKKSLVFALILNVLLSVLFLSGNKVFAADLVAEAGPNQEVTVNQQVNFEGIASTGSVVTYVWDFGDGNIADARNPSHIYTSVGTYTVTLTVSDVIGGNSTDTLTVTVANMGPPSPPSNLTAYGGDNIVALAWDEHPESDFVGYNLYRSQTQGGPYTKINGALLTDNSYNDGPVTNGTPYYYVVTAEDISSYESGYSAEAAVTPGSTGPTVEGGSLTGSNTWTLSASPYQVTSNLTVTSGASLTIEPGVVIKFDSGITMDIQGSFHVIGTKANEVTFTSGEAAPQKGDWGGITYTHNSGSSFTMDYAIVEYGSFGIDYSANADIVSPSITNSKIRYNGGNGIKIYAAGTAVMTLMLEGNEVYNNSGRGIYCYAYGSSVSFNSTVRNNEVYNNDNYGVHQETNGADYTILVEKNIIYNNYYCGLYNKSVISPVGSSFSARGNTIYGHSMYGIWWYMFAGTHTGVIDGNTINGNRTGIYVKNYGATVSNLEIVNNEVHANTDKGISWDSNNANMIPVLLYNDIYNNANYGIHILSTGATSVINYNNIYDNPYGIYNNVGRTVDGRMNWWGTAVTTEMEESYPRDISVIYDIFDNGTKGMVDYAGWLSGAASMDSSLVSNITSPLDGDAVRPGVYTITGVASAEAGIEEVEVSVDGGYSWQVASGTNSWSYVWTIPGDSLYNIRSRVTDKNLVQESPGAGVNLTVDSNLPTQSGSLIEDENWSGIVYLMGDVTVPAGLTLTIEPGTVVNFPALYDETGGGSDPSRSELIVNGSLIIAGTSDDRVTFTSSSINPQENDWGGIDYTYNSGSIFSIDYALVEYGSYGIAYSTDTGTLGPSITNSIVRNTGGDGISITASTTSNAIVLTLMLEGNEVYNNSGRGIYCYAFEYNAGSVTFDGKVINNNVYDNNNHGIYLETNGADYTILVEQNNIYGNNNHGLYSDNYNPSINGSFTARNNTVYQNNQIGIMWDVTLGDHNGVIDNNTVNNNNATGIYIKNTSAVVSNLGIVNNIVNDNTDGIRLLSNNADMIPVVVYNDIYDNTDNGIKIQSAGATSVINYNNIYGNTNFGIYNNAAIAVDGRLNWWGTAVTTEIDSTIYDIFDDSSKGVVVYDRWDSSLLSLDNVPVSYITDPLDGDTVRPGIYTISGVASAGENIEKVEISLDGGLNWNIAGGANEWSYEWEAEVDGAYSIKSRVTDKYGLIETAGPGITVTVDSGLSSITTSGTLLVDENWSGIVNLTGDVTVPAGKTLTINAGTVVNFPALHDDTYGGSDTSRTELIVNGSLNVAGASGSYVTFTSNADPAQKNDWGGINYTHSAGSSFSMDYAIVEYGTYGIAYRTYTGTLSPSITNSIVRYTGGDGISIKAIGTTYINGQAWYRHIEMTLTLEGNEVHHNDGLGIYCYADTSDTTLDAKVKNNYVYNNNGYGIHIQTNFSATYTTLIEGNSIYENSSYGLYSQSSASKGSFTARNNTINNNSVYGIYWDTGGRTHSGVIDNNTITNNGTGIYVDNSNATVSSIGIVNNIVNDNADGIKLDSNNADMTPVVVYNDIYGNTDNGIYIASAGATSIINYNNIYGNTNFGIYNNSASAVDGRLNWWGTTVATEIESAIYDILDPGNQGMVDYAGWLSSVLSTDSNLISFITNPFDGDSVTPGVYTITGVAYAGAGIEKVEVNVDGEWLLATGTHSWSYDWTIPGDSVYNIVSRVTDFDSIVEVPGTGVSLTVDSNQFTTSGIVSAHETWSGTVNLTGDVIVPAGVTLTIESGTEIIFPALQDDTYGGSDSSRTELIVEGSLIVNGGPGSLVEFTSSNTVSPQKNDWGGISFTHNPGEMFLVNYALIENSSYGIKYSSSSGIHDASLKNSIIQHTGSDGVYVSINVNSQVFFEISNNVIQDNDRYGIFAMDYSSSELVLSVTFNAINSNDTGLWLHNVTDPVLANNDIFDNTTYGLDASTNMSARLNWWNDSAGPFGPTGDSIDGNVEYSPWVEQNITPDFYIVDAVVTSPEFSQNGSTTVFAASSSETADWTIEIYDSLSQLVRTMNPAGDTINISWDGKDDSQTPLGDGTYTYKIIAERNSDQLAAATAVGTIDLENALPVAEITSPEQSAIYISGDITITGTADSANFSSYSLAYGRGENPSIWYSISTGPSPVIDGTLGTWTATNVTQEFYTIRLQVTDTFAKTAETRVTVKMLSIYAVSDGPDPFSPNGDSINETTTIKASFTMPVDWNISIKDSIPDQVKYFEGSGRTINQIWDGTDTALLPVDEGTYTYEIGATEPVSGTVLPPVSSGTIVIDKTSPTASFSSITNGQIITGDIDLDISGTAFDDNISYYKVEYGAGLSPTTWMLIDEGYSNVTSGPLAVWETGGIPNGDYTVRLTVIDDGGTENITSVLVTIDSIKITNISVTATAISPLNSETSGISYDIDRDADVTVRIYDKDALSVRTLISAVPQLQGPNVVYWDGKDDSDTIVPFEAYTYTIEASNSMGRSGIYDPEHVPGTVAIHSSNATPYFEPFKGENSEIIYELIAPARVTLGIGIRGGQTPPKTLIDNEPRDVTDNKELWNGLDDNGVLLEPDLYYIFGWTEILPENVIITKNDTFSVTSLSAEAFQIIPSFSEVSTIYYTISADADVTIDIYDPNGSHIWTLLNNVPKTTGVVHEIQWDGMNEAGELVSSVGAYSMEVTITNSDGISTIRRGTLFIY